MDKLDLALEHWRVALWLLVFTLVAWLPFALFAVAETSGPAVSLLPSGVRADLEHTKERTEEMEKQLGPLIDELQAQFDTYSEMDCDGSGDEGCRQIADNIGRKYEELIERVDKGLKEVEPIVQGTLKELGGRLRSQVGRKMTPRDIQKYLAEHGAGPSPRPSRRSGGVAATFARVLDMISQGNRQSPMLLSSEIHLDLSDALGYIQQARAEVGNQLIVMGTRGEYFGHVDDQMINTVKAVNTLVFGPPEDGFEDLPPAVDPPGPSRGSRWEQ